MEIKYQFSRYWRVARSQYVELRGLIATKLFESTRRLFLHFLHVDTSIQAMCCVELAPMLTHRYQLQKVQLSLDLDSRV